MKVVQIPKSEMEEVLKSNHPKYFTYSISHDKSRVEFGPVSSEGRSSIPYFIYEKGKYEGGIHASTEFLAAQIDLHLAKKENGECFIGVAILKGLLKDKESSIFGYLEGDEAFMKFESVSSKKKITYTYDKYAFGNEDRLAFDLSTVVCTFVEEPIEKEMPPEQEDQWDEALRGKKMSSSKGKVIYKYQIPILETVDMRLPEGYEIIRVDSENGMFWLWAIVDTEAPDTDVRLYSVKCGGNMPDVEGLKYLGYCTIFIQQELALYLFLDPNFKKEI
uniref:DUF7352 domain-containing protein n=1 Tax=Rhizobium phage IG49 TaxID=3129228 RepID=A0AAU8HYW5_9CAUD